MKKPELTKEERARLEHNFAVLYGHKVAGSDNLVHLIDGRKVPPKKSQVIVAAPARTVVVCGYCKLKSDKTMGSCPGCGAPI